VDEAAKQRFLEQLEAMKRAYVARFPEQADELEGLRGRLRADDHDAVSRVEAIVHRMAGTAGSYGLSEISLAATELDVRIKQGAAAASLVADLDALISLMRRAV
jgi:HPt (histidine-containing phosphotransfer) domain-containing protein